MRPNYSTFYAGEKNSQLLKKIYLTFHEDYSFRYSIQTYIFLQDSFYNAEVTCKRETVAFSKWQNIFITQLIYITLYNTKLT